MLFFTKEFVMQKLYILFLPLFLTHALLCQASAYEKLAIVAVHVGIPLALCAGNHLMKYLDYKPQITVSNHDHANFEKIIRKTHGPEALTLVQQVMNNMNRTALDITYEYCTFNFQPSRLIFYHDQKVKTDIINQIDRQRYRDWMLLVHTSLSTDRKTVVSFDKLITVKETPHDRTYA